MVQRQTLKIRTSTQNTITKERFKIMESIYLVALSKPEKQPEIQEQTESDNSSDQKPTTRSEE